MWQSIGKTLFVNYTLNCSKKEVSLSINHNKINTLRFNYPSVKSIIAPLSYIEDVKYRNIDPWKGEHILYTFSQSIHEFKYLEN